MELDLVALLGDLLAAATGKQWGVVASLLLIGLVFALRKYVAPKVPFLASDSGGVLLAFVGGFGLALKDHFSLGQAFSWAAMVAAAKLSFWAMGGYVALKKFAMPLLLRLWGWLAPKLGLAPKAEGA